MVKRLTISITEWVYDSFLKPINNKSRYVEECIIKSSTSPNMAEALTKANERIRELEEATTSDTKEMYDFEKDFWKVLISGVERGRVQQVPSIHLINHYYTLSGQRLSFGQFMERFNKYKEHPELLVKNEEVAPDVNQS